MNSRVMLLLGLATLGAWAVSRLERQSSVPSLPAPVASEMLYKQPATIPLGSSAPVDSPRIVAGRFERSGQVVPLQAGRRYFVTMKSTGLGAPLKKANAQSLGLSLSQNPDFSDVTVYADGTVTLDYRPKAAGESLTVGGSIAIGPAAVTITAIYALSDVRPASS